MRAADAAARQAEVGSRFEVIVFTASLAKYADPLLDLLDRSSCVRWRLFRESCYPYEGNYVKDLTCLGRPLKDVVIVDNSPHSYIFHPFNAVRGCCSALCAGARLSGCAAGADLELYRRHVGARLAGPAAAHAEPGGGGRRHQSHRGDIPTRRDACARRGWKIAEACTRLLAVVQATEPNLPTCPRQRI